MACSFRVLPSKLTSAQKVVDVTSPTMAAWLSVLQAANRWLTSLKKMHRQPFTGCYNKHHLKKNILKLLFGWCLDQSTLKPGKNILLKQPVSSCFQPFRPSPIQVLGKGGSWGVARYASGECACGCVAPPTLRNHCEKKTQWIPNIWEMVISHDKTPTKTHDMTFQKGYPPNKKSRTRSDGPWWALGLKKEQVGSFFFQFAHNFGAVFFFFCCPTLLRRYVKTEARRWHSQACLLILKDSGVGCIVYMSIV